MRGRSWRACTRTTTGSRLDLIVLYICTFFLCFPLLLSSSLLLLFSSPALPASCSGSESGGQKLRNSARGVSLVQMQMQQERGEREDCTTKMVVEGGSSQAKRLKSGPGGVVDLVRAAIVDRPLEHIQMTTPSSLFTSLLIPRASILMRVLEHVQMTIPSCPVTSPFIPGASILMRVLEHIQVTTPSCSFTSLLIPGASILSSVLEHIQTTTPSCLITSLLIPGASILMRVLEYIKMTPPSCYPTSLLIPGASILMQELEHIKMTTPSCCSTSPLIPRIALALELLQGLQLASLRCEEQSKNRVRSRNKEEEIVKRETHQQTWVSLCQAFSNLLIASAAEASTHGTPRGP